MLLLQIRFQFKWSSVLGIKTPANIKLEGGSIAQWLADLLPDTAALGLIPCVPKNFLRKKISMLLRLINGPAQRKVNSGLEMLTESI